MRFLITVKTRIFRKMGNKLLEKDCEMLVVFRKLSVNFRKN